MMKIMNIDARWWCFPDLVKKECSYRSKYFGVATLDLRQPTANRFFSGFGEAE